MTVHPSQTLRILMLHGYTQSGPLFRAKTRALEKSLNKQFPRIKITLVYPTAPLHIAPSDIPGLSPSSNANAIDELREEAYGWWRRRDQSSSSTADGGTGDVRNGAGFTYEGIYDGLGTVAECLRAEGPFDGVVGFSQGGALAAMVASLLEPGRRQRFASREALGGMAWPSSFSMPARSCASDGADPETENAELTPIHPPLRFAASYSGFAPQPLPDLYRAFYDPKIATPMLHFLGDVDTVVEESRSLALVDACLAGRVVRHPGGHFLPASSRECVAALVALIRETVSWDGDGSVAGEKGSQASGRMSHDASRGDEKVEGAVEDMKVPF